MKILHVVHQYLPEQVGGTEFYTNWVAHRLAQRGHQVEILYRRYADGAGYDSRFDDGVRVWATWSGSLSPNRRFLATFHDKNILGAFRRIVQTVQPELVHIQHLMGLPVALVDHLRQCHIPFIITLHDYWWICANAQLLTNYSRELCNGPHLHLNCGRCTLARTGHPDLWPALPPLAGLLAWRNHRLRQVMNRACKLIAPSRFVRDWHAAHGVPAHKLKVIPHGLDLPSAHPRPIQEQRAPSRIAYIGGLSWQKGVHILVEACRDFEAEAELWIAGDETADPAYVSDLRALASPQVRFLGRLTRESVWDTLAQVDIVVVPALWYETFSFIVSEAFAAGVPVVASRLGPLADRVRDEVDGLLVRPGDPQALRQVLLRFWQEPGLLARLRAGIRPVRTLENHVTELESVYKTVV